METVAPDPDGVLSIVKSAEEGRGHSPGNHSGRKSADNECETTATGNVPDWISRLLLRFGVRRKVLLSWAVVHEQPHLVLAFSSSAAVFAIVLNTYSLLLSQPWRWSHHGPALAYSFCHGLAILLLWFCGLSVSKTKAYYLLITSCIILQFQAAIRLMMGPIEQVPFNHRLLYAVINAIALANWTIASLLGAWAPDHPPTPFRSFLTAIADTAVRTLRLSDAITDMLVIRLMLQQVDCASWIFMSCVAGAFVVLDLACGLFLSMFGSGLGRKNISPQKKKWFFVAHVISLLCETGIIIVTLMQLISELKDPRNADERRVKANAIVLTVVSFLTTLTTFSISFVGLHQIVASMSQVAIIFSRKPTVVRHLVELHVGQSCEEFPTPSSDIHDSPKDTFARP